MESIKIFMITKEKNQHLPMSMSVCMTGLRISAIDFDLQCCYFSGVSGAHIKLTSLYTTVLTSKVDKEQLVIKRL